MNAINLSSFFGGTSIFPVYIVRLHLLSLEVHHFRVGPEFAQGNWEQLPCKHIAAPPPSPRFMKSIYPAALLCCGRGVRLRTAFREGGGKGREQENSIIPLSAVFHSLLFLTLSNPSELDRYWQCQKGCGGRQTCSPIIKVCSFSLKSVIRLKYETVFQARCKKESAASATFLQNHV